VRPIDLAAFFAAIANEGLHPSPYVIDAIERNGAVIYRHDPKSSVVIGSVDRAAFYQLKTMLQGVLARGTARSIASLAPYVAGKTGTSDDENDAWFVGFTNDVTVAVWIGYDNAGGKRHTLGGGSTGGGVAVPIFEPVIQAVWAHVAPRTALAPPSSEARRQLTCKSMNEESGDVPSGSRKAITECLRVDAKGKVVDTQYRLVSRASGYGDDRQDGSARNRAQPANDAFREMFNQPGYGGPAYDTWRAPAQRPQYSSQGGIQHSSEGGITQPNWQREYRLQHPD
jgi:membrane carboxypeptidase/penicillin-binding protein